MLDGTKLYLFITLSVTMTLFQSHKSVSFTETFYVLIRLSRHFVGLFSSSKRSWICHYFIYIFFHFFYFRIYSREIIDMFPNLTNTVWLAFSQALFKRYFSNFALLLPCLGSTNSYQLRWPWPCLRSQVCQNHTLKIVFKNFCPRSLNVVWFLHTLKRSGKIYFVW